MIRRLRKSEFDEKIERYIGPHPEDDKPRARAGASPAEPARRRASRAPRSTSAARRRTRGPAAHPRGPLSCPRPLRKPPHPRERVRRGQRSRPHRPPIPPNHRRAGDRAAPNVAPSAASAAPASLRGRAGGRGPTRRDHRQVRLGASSRARRGDPRAAPRRVSGVERARSPRGHPPPPRGDLRPHVVWVLRHDHAVDAISGHPLRIYRHLRQPRPSRGARRGERATNGPADFRGRREHRRLPGPPREVREGRFPARARATVGGQRDVGALRSRS